MKKRVPTGVLLSMLSLAGCSSQPKLEDIPVDADRLTTAEREKFPEFITIPAAELSELTPASSDDMAVGMEWQRSGGGPKNLRYSPADQINAGNVAQLEVAWIYHARDGASNIQSNPVVGEGLLFTPTPGKNIVAIEAATGKEVWRYTLPFSKDAMPFGPATRGLTYFPGNSEIDSRIYLSCNGYLFALDARTGKPVASFGQGGKAPSAKFPGRSPYPGTVAPAIAGDLVIAVNQTYIEAFDLESGKPRWQFKTLTYHVADGTRDNGGNSWGGLAIDVARGIVFAPVGDPHPNYVGVGRRGNNAHTNSLIALDLRTGKLRWSFQNIRHDIWDLDIATFPTLVTVTRSGKRYAAVAQPTKQGTILLLDRLSGKPLFPFRMRRAPSSRVEGEYTAVYQPAPLVPEPFSRQAFSRNDMSNIDPKSKAEAAKQIAESNVGWFKPHDLDKSTIFYGIHGGSDWPGGSFDLASGMFYIAANQIAFKTTLSKLNVEDLALVDSKSPGAAIFQQNCAVCHGADRRGQGMAPSLIGVKDRMRPEDFASLLQTGRQGMPSFAQLSATKQRLLLEYLWGFEERFAKSRAEYKVARPAKEMPERMYTLSHFSRFEDAAGYPLSRPPWGTLNAINLNTGKLEWKVPLGEYAELTRRGVPKTGTENFGGPIVTAGGLVFVAGTRDLMIRAFDKRNGRELWKYKLPFGGFAPPSTYMIDGRQYVVIPATGGGKLGSQPGDAWIAFALPRMSSTTGDHK